MSLDGYIAGPKGEADWIIMDPEIDFGALFNEFDTLLMGRKTFEVLNAQGPGGPMESMEITAAIQGLQALKQRCEVKLVTDSEYLKNGITKWINGWKRNGWKTADRKPVKNADLWQQLDALSRQIYGHAGGEFNINSPKQLAVVLFENLISVGAHVQSGKLRVLAVGASRRSSALPEVPTVAEAGVPGYDVVIWFGMLAPAATPKEIAFPPTSTFH